MKRLFLLLFGCALVAMLSSASGCKNKRETPAPAPTVSAPAPPVAAPAAAPEIIKEPAKALNARVRIKTKFGDMVVKLYDETPLHRDNFLKLVEQKFYDGLLFHRCIPKFMIQGGDPDSRGASQNQHLGMGGPGYTVPAEFNQAFIHKKGALSAARRGDQINPKRESSGSQFYIVQGTVQTDMQLNQREMYIRSRTPDFKYTEEQRNLYKTVGGTPQLDMDYTVFGEVLEGLDVIDKIAAQPTSPGDRPIEDVIMNMEVIE